MLSCSGPDGLCQYRDEWHLGELSLLGTQLVTRRGWCKLSTIQPFVLFLWHQNVNLMRSCRLSYVIISGKRVSHRYQPSYVYANKLKQFLSEILHAIENLAGDIFLMKWYRRKIHMSKFLLFCCHCLNLYYAYRGRPPYLNLFVLCILYLLMSTSANTRHTTM